tara:strand:+ start:1294 stop:1794 length:501 start_codon:yes stop_codon:yes gene_type:complete
MTQDNSIVRITQELLDLGRSRNERWSKEQRRLLGIVPPWPPNLMPIGETIGKTISKENADNFVLLKDRHLENKNPKNMRTKERRGHPKSPDLSNQLPDYYPKDAPTSFTRESGTTPLERSGKIDPERDEPGPRLERVAKQKCPNCSSTNLKLAGGLECMVCGHVIS